MGHHERTTVAARYHRLAGNHRRIAPPNATLVDSDPIDCQNIYNDLLNIIYNAHCIHRAVTDLHPGLPAATACRIPSLLFRPVSDHALIPPPRSPSLAPPAGLCRDTDIGCGAASGV
ncbi:MAG TPA: hypothetical protein VN153_05990, partial [Tahibacter sp.]|nr:hypothetical protein [Tahibacter sp.]